MAKGRLRVRLKSFDHRVIDEAAAKLLETALATGAKISGPVPLPTDRRLIAVTTSPHVDKNAREHFEMLIHKRVIDIIDPTDKTIDALSRMELPAGVDIEVKM
jgi:small subunit ribosomal protein S10